MQPMQKSHFDFYRETNAVLVDAIRQRVAAAELEQPVWNIEEILGSEGDMRALITRWAQDGYKRHEREYQRRGIGIQEAYEQKFASGEVDKFIDGHAASYVTCFNHILFGEETFHVSGQLASRLAHTDMNVPSEMVRLPFKSCLFLFDDEETLEALYALKSDNGFPPVQGPVSVFLTELKNGDERVLRIAAFHNNGKRTPFGIKRDLRLVPGETLEQAFRTHWGEPSVDGGLYEYFDDKPFMEEGLKFIRTVLNVALYLSSASPDVSEALHARDRVEPLGPGRSAQRHREHDARIRENFTAARYVEVGGSYRPVDLDDGEDAERRSEGRELVERIRVRGHWKQQPHGPGHSLRKLLWLEPYWRGPDLAEVVSRPYRIS